MDWHVDVMLLLLGKIDTIVTVARTVFEIHFVPAATDPAVVVRVGLLLYLVEDRALLLLGYPFFNKHLDELVVLEGPNEAASIDPSLVAFHMYAKNVMVVFEAFSYYFHLRPANAVVTDVNVHETFVFLKAF